MRDTKRKRVEAAGWRIGSAAEFLNLSTSEAVYVELKLRLAANLRERRKKQHLSQEELAEVVKSSQSRVAKMEAGDPSVSVDLILQQVEGKSMLD